MVAAAARHLPFYSSHRGRWLPSLAAAAVAPRLRAAATLACRETPRRLAMARPLAWLQLTLAAARQLPRGSRGCPGRAVRRTQRMRLAEGCSGAQAWEGRVALVQHHAVRSRSAAWGGLLADLLAATQMGEQGVAAAFSAAVAARTVSGVRPLVAAGQVVAAALM